MGRRRHHAGMDTFVAAAVPSVRNATADQIGRKVALPMSFVSERTNLCGPLDAGAGLAAPSVATVSDYIALMKPRVMSLVVFTALVGLAVASSSLHPLNGFTAFLFFALCAVCSG